ncbi:MAG: signal peptide peptidase SppA [Candidatus Schekmanbacteria bacterium]|nr:signal peptide peptidase SppA [Candidatus Schekmanbacteria bacterium]
MIRCLLNKLLPVTAVLLLLNGCVFVSMPLLLSKQPLREHVVAGFGKEKILLIDISGMISVEDKAELGGMQYEPSLVARLKEELRLAQEDPAVRAVILKINSPGGMVTASDIIHHELLTYKNKYGVKIVACFMEMGTSGAYYIATAADKIWAHPTSITGSIGVIVMKFNMSELMGKIGVQDESIKSGNKKDILMPFRATTPDERRIVQGLVDQMQQRFLQVIYDGRPKIDKEKLLEIADGRILSPTEAQNVGLIDQIGYLDNAIEDARLLIGSPTARIIMYAPPYIQKANIYTQAQSGTNLLPGVESYLPFRYPFSGLLPSPNPYFMYYWMPQAGQ